MISELTCPVCGKVVKTTHPMQTIAAQMRDHLRTHGSTIREARRQVNKLLSEPVKKQFIQVGERIRSLKDYGYRYANWPEGKWITEGTTAEVIEYSPEQPKLVVRGEVFEGIEASATVRWEFGGETVIYADGEGKRWERIKPEPEKSELTKDPYR